MQVYLRYSLFIKVDDIMFNSSAKAFIKFESSNTIVDDIKAKYSKEFSKSFEKSSSDYIDKIKMKYMDSRRENKFSTDKMIEEKMRKYRCEIGNDSLRLENGGRVEVKDESNKVIFDKLKAIEDALNKLKKEKEVVIDNTIKIVKNKNIIQNKINDKNINEENKILLRNEEINPPISTLKEDQTTQLDDNFDNIIPIVERITKIKELKKQHESKCNKIK